MIVISIHLLLSGLESRKIAKHDRLPVSYTRIHIVPRKSFELLKIGHLPEYVNSLHSGYLILDLSVIDYLCNRRSLCSQGNSSGTSMLLK